MEKTSVYLTKYDEQDTYKLIKVEDTAVFRCSVDMIRIL